MNKKKIIFLSIIWVLVLLLFILLLLSSLSWWKNTIKTVKKWFSIWTYWQDKDTFNEYLNEYKKRKWLDKSTFIVENFDNYKEYNIALASALLRWEWPDIFMLNNNEISFMSEHTFWLDSNSIDIDEFSDSFVWFFGDDLIVSSWEEDNKINYVTWIPMWYETLGVIYNRKYVSADDVSHLWKLNKVIDKIAATNSNIIPFWIWYWKSVDLAWDIATQFFMLEDIISYDKVNSSILRSALTSYYKFWEKYIDQFKRYSNAWNTTLNWFMKRQVAMVVWYPSTLNKMSSFDNSTVEKSRVEAKPFPEYSSVWWKALVNYNYFVINKDTDNFNWSVNLLSYMFSEQWQESYLEKFKFLLPARLSLEDKFFSKTINKAFSKIKLKDFYNNWDMPYYSFNKWIKIIYDEDIIDILDNHIDWIEKFWKFKKSLECMTDKILNLKSLSKSCIIK